MKKFLLIGIGGVYNYGCEAIVRGTAKLLRDLRPDAEIYYASPRPEDDRQRLSDCAIKVITRRRIFRYSPKNVARKLLGYCGIRYRPCCDPPRQAEGMDAVFSIGGDIYTLTNSSDFNTSIVKFGDAVLAKRVPYILWGASVGPFSNAPMIEQMLKRHLARLSAIVAREHRTIRYLESLGITDNVTFYPDPAFFVDTDIVKREHDCHNHNKLIGINLSPLSVRHLNIPLEKALMDQASAIVAIANEFGADVVLIPHVWCSFSERDDDFRYLQKVKESIPGAIKIVYILSGMIRALSG